MKRILVWLLFAGICIFALCAKFRDDNPVASDYQGDYSLKVKLESPADTLDVFKQYAFVCSTGADTFSSYSFTNASFVADSIARPRTKGADTVYFHCVSRFFGDSATIEGVRPNGVTVTAKVKLHVVSNYSIAWANAETKEAFAGESVSLRIAYAGAPSRSTRVLWHVPDAQADTLPVDGVFVFKVDEDATGFITVSANLIDKAGNSMALDLFTATMAVRPEISTVKMCGNAIRGEPLKLCITQKGANTDSIRAYLLLGNWQDSSAILSPIAVDTVAFTRPLTDTGSKTFKVYLANAKHPQLKSNAVQLTATIAYVLPVILFTGPDTLVLPLNDSFPVTVSSNPEATWYVWQIDSLGPDTTSSQNTEVMLSDTLPHRLKVYGIDEYGYCGKSDSIPIIAKKCVYYITPKEFPEIAKAKSWTMWIAGASNEEYAKQSNARYTWTLSSNNYDSMKLSGKTNDTLRLLWLDTAHVTITLTVIDDSSDGCAAYVKGITVRRFSPWLLFKNRTYSFKTTDSVMCGVSASDSNADGSIDSIFWIRGGKNPAATRTSDSVMKVISTVPDSFWIKAYARDNDGFESNMDSAYFMVIACRPYILPQMSDDTIFMNLPDTFVAHGNVSDSSAVIAMYSWDFDGNGTWDDSSSDSAMAHSFATAGNSIVIVKCRDNKGLESAPDTFAVTVSTGEPSVQDISPDTAWLGELKLYTVSAKTPKPLDAITEYYVSWNNSMTFTQYDTEAFPYQYPDSGKHSLRVYVKSKDGLISDTLSDTIFVDPARPVIDSIMLDASWMNVFVNDTHAYTLVDRVPHGTVDSCVIVWGSAAGTSPQRANIFSHKYSISDTGPQMMKAAVMNNNKIWSDTVSKQVRVRLGKPVVDNLTPRTIWVNDDTLFTVTAHDTNGTVDSIMVRWGDGIDSVRAKTSMTHKYDITKSGVKSVKVFCRDNDGILSDTATVNITVKLGKPLLGPINMNVYPYDVYFKDLLTLTVTYLDSNGTVDSIGIDSGTGTFSSYRKVTGLNSSSFTRMFGRSEVGSKVIRVRVKDNDGVVSDTVKDTLDVKLGAPVVDSVSVDTGRGNVFVNDTQRFKVYVRDLNGSVKKIYASWNNDTIAEDSIDVPTSVSSGSWSFSHPFGVPDSGLRKILFWTQDEDSVLSPRKKDSVVVRVAAPVLWGDKGDTLWVVVNDNYDKSYPIHMNSLDTNGANQKPVRYYWQASGQPFDTTQSEVAGLFRKSSQDTVYWLLLNQSTPNQSKQLWIAALDDDKFLRGRMSGTPWIVFADSAPPKPGMISEQYPDSVLIRWDNYDAKDGPDSTIFEVLIGPINETPTTRKVIQAGALFPKASGHYTYKIGLISESFSYRVIAQDKRGTRSLGDIRNYTP